MICFTTLLHHYWNTILNSWPSTKKKSQMRQLTLYKILRIFILCMYDVDASSVKTFILLYFTFKSIKYVVILFMIYTIVTLLVVFSIFGFENKAVAWLIYPNKFVQFTSGGIETGTFLLGARDVTCWTITCF